MAVRPSAGVFEYKQRYLVVEITGTKGAGNARWELIMQGYLSHHFTAMLLEPFYTPVQDSSVIDLITRGVGNFHGVLRIRPCSHTFKSMKWSPLGQTKFCRA
jgi:hypothetical protein